MHLVMGHSQTGLGDAQAGQFPALNLQNKSVMSKTKYLNCIREIANITFNVIFCFAYVLSSHSYIIKHTGPVMGVSSVGDGGVATPLLLKQGDYFCLECQQGGDSKRLLLYSLRFLPHLTNGKYASIT